MILFAFKYCIVGYGDIVPFTWGGRVVACIMMYIGVVFVAFPVAVLSANFQDLLERQIDKQKIEKQDMKYINEAKDEKERNGRIKSLCKFYDCLNRKSSVFITTPSNERFKVNKKISNPIKNLTKSFSKKTPRIRRRNATRNLLDDSIHVNESVDGDNDGRGRNQSLGKRTFTTKFTFLYVICMIIVTAVVVCYFTFICVDYFVIFVMY